MAIGKAITSTVSAAKDFNQAMADLKAVSGATAIEMGKLSAQAIKAGAATKFSANEAAQGQIALSKAGLSASQIMGGGLQTALALAAAGDIEVGQAAEMAANAMKLFNLQGKDLSGVADAMATAANSTTADVGDFAIALSQGGAAAKQAGLSFKDTMVVLEALAEQGVKGSDAGTSLKTALLSLAAPVGDGAAAIKKYGLEFFKSNGEIKSAAGLAGELNSKLGGLNKQQRTAVLQAIAGRDGFRTLAAMMDTGAGKVARMRRELDKVGSAAKVAADRQDSLSGDVEQLTGSIETLQIKAMGKVVPMLRQAAQGATSFINALGDGSGAVGAFASDLGAIATGVGQAAGNLLGFAVVAAKVVGAVVAPFVSLSAALYASGAGAQVLTGVVVGMGAAFVVAKVAAAALFAITKAQAILQSAAAFIQLARTVTTAGEAMALMQAATLATPWGLVAAGVGLAAGAVIALSGAFRSGKSAADVQRDSMKTVADAARDVTSALDTAEQSVLDYQRAQLNAKQASLDITLAQKAYNEAVKQYGRNSLEAAQANVQLEQAKLRGIETSRTAAQAADVEKRKIIESAETILRKNTEQKAAIATMEQQLASQRALNSGTAEGRVKIAEMTATLAAMKGQQGASRDQFISLTGAARRLAGTLKGDTRPGVAAVRQQLLDFANAKPADLPKVIAAIKAGVTKGSAAAKAGADKTKTQLKNVDTSVSLTSWIQGINSSGLAATQVAQMHAANIRAALASANADVRNSPSANDRMRTSMIRMQGITATGMKQTNAVTKRGVDAIIASRQKLDDQLARIDRAAAARDGSRGRLQNRADAAGRVESTFSDVESRAGDLISRIGAALDERVAVYDRRLSEITTRRNILQGGKAIRDADQALSAAQSRLEAVRNSITGAASDAERETAQRYLDQAVNDVEDAKLAAEAARLQVERDKTSLTVDKKKQQVERSIGNLVERLRAGEISGKRFNREITRILGDPVVRSAIQASGTSLGLAFARGMARTEQQVKAGAIRLATIVAQYLKLRSPAEKGPLAFDFTRSGAAIGNDFAAGLAGRQAAMASQARSFALAAIPVVRVGTNTGAQPVTQAGGLVQHNTFNVQGPFDARQASHDLRWEAQYRPAGTVS